MGTLVNGIKEIFATAKTTGSNVMLCGNDGTPDGHMTMANLASVLGVIYHGGALDESADNKKSDSVYFVYGDTSKNTPTGHGVLVTLVSSLSGSYGSSISQQFFDNSDGGYYTRIANSGVWGEWQSVPKFYKNYADLSSLANALGVSALKSSSLFRIISGEVPQNQTIDVSCGNGLLFVGVFSGGTLYWPNYWSTEVQIIAGTTNTQYTVTKSAETTVVHITSPSNYNVSYAYIGFTR